MTAFRKSKYTHLKALIILSFLLIGTGFVGVYAALQTQTDNPDVTELLEGTSDLDVSPNMTIIPSLTPPSTLTPTSLDPSMALFVAGTTWASNNGTSVLYINWYDNYVIHHSSDPDWGPWWREGQLPEIKNVTVNLLEQLDFTVTCTGEVPESLSGYNLVIFEAWFAMQPKHSQLVRDYLTDGGNIVIIGGVPCYFATYCRDMWPYVTGGTNLTNLSDWFGGAQFVNTGGAAKLVVDKPFEINLENGTVVYQINAYGCYAISDMNSGTKIIALWSEGLVYSFIYEYGKGRVFYQAEMVW